MLFNSYEFIFAFLPLTLVVFIIISKFDHEKALGWLVVASLFFYGWWNPDYLLLIVGSMLVNYMIGYIINKRRATGKGHTVFLVLGVALNLGLLGYYKYANFFMDNLLALTGMDYNLGHIILPLAISFFTFQQIAYLVDSHRGITEEYKFMHYALFVTFFPQLIAGPIVHHKEMLPQFAKRGIKLDNITIGLMIFSLGLFKKAVLADGIAVYATPVFDLARAGEELGFFQSWGGALSYTFQLYFDFSGYSDMAIGAARLFGIKLPLNFHSPYRATNITEFWRRWHITLSRFLRDYIYIPLGGNRKGNFQRYNNLMITMLLGGLWHGAGWAFVIWGGLHGLYLVINHFWHFLARVFGLQNFCASTVWRTISWFITFTAVVVGWVFFRAEDVGAASRILAGMAGLNGVSIPQGLALHLGALGGALQNMGVEISMESGSQFVFTYLWIAFLLPVALIFPNTQQWMAAFQPAFNEIHDQPSTTVFHNNIVMRLFRFNMSRLWALGCAGLSTLGILALSQISEFLYFQF